MKNGTTTKLFASLAVTFFTSFLFAQDQNLTAANNFKPKQITNITAILENGAFSPTTATVYVKAKVMRTFLDMFSEATEVNWNENDGRYFASFTLAGKLCKALFDGQGRLIYRIRYSKENDLPREVRKLLKSAYVDFTIGAVTEVDSENIKSWVVNLTDKNNLVVARVSDGTLTEVHSYKTHF